MLDLTATATRIGNYVWFEQRLYEVLGGWAATTTTDDPGVKVWFAEVAKHHAWHAELWSRRLPQVRGLDAVSVTDAPSPAVERFVAELADTSPTVDRLVGLMRVALPRLIVALDEHRDLAMPVADRSVIRTIRVVRDDLVDDWATGELLLQRAIAAGPDVERAGRAQIDFDALVAGSTGIGASVPVR